jgi:hypothetical protein
VRAEPILDALGANRLHIRVARCAQRSDEQLDLDCLKIRSTNYKASDGTSFETHAYRNAQSGEVVEPKTKFQ